MALYIFIVLANIAGMILNLITLSRKSLSKSDTAMVVFTLLFQLVMISYFGAKLDRLLLP